MWIDYFSTRETVTYGNDFIKKYITYRISISKSQNR